jgi:hypothetical protein
MCYTYVRVSHAYAVQRAHAVCLHALSALYARSTLPAHAVRIRTCCATCTRSAGRTRCVIRTCCVPHAHAEPHAHAALARTCCAPCTRCAGVTRCASSHLLHYIRALLRTHMLRYTHALCVNTHSVLHVRTVWYVHILQLMLSTVNAVLIHTRGVALYYLCRIVHAHLCAMCARCACCAPVHATWLLSGTCTT